MLTDNDLIRSLRDQIQSHLGREFTGELVLKPSFQRAKRAADYFHPTGFRHQHLVRQFDYDDILRWMIPVAMSNRMGGLNKRIAGKTGFAITSTAVVLGLVADISYALHTYRIHTSASRLIPWGSTVEEVLAFCFLASLGGLLVGFLICLCSLPRRSARWGIRLAFVCFAIHVATVYYARDMFFNFA